MRIAENITKLVGKTPLVRLGKFSQEVEGELVAKLEFFNPTASIKDRTALSMVESAEKEGLLTKHTVIIEPTSGNTGIALAFICAQKGYRLIITMPENASEEKKKLIELLGGEVILTSAQQGMKGALEEAKLLAKKIPNSLILNQFENIANPRIHRETTAEEIWQDTEGKVDIIVTGIGTGGTITGIAQTLKKRKTSLKIIGVEPANSAILTGKKPGKHKIQGIGAGFIPKILRVDLIDEIVTVSDEEAIKTTYQLARKEGILAGISSGAAVWAGIKIAKRKENKNKLIVIILPDTGERYLSFWLKNL